LSSIKQGKKGFYEKLCYRLDKFSKNLYNKRREKPFERGRNMLDYTKAAVKKTVDDFRRLDYLRNLVTQVVYIFYLVYALFAGAGYVWANAVLRGLSLAYLIFF
jgi:hypothetical protein